MSHIQCMILRDSFDIHIMKYLSCKPMWTKHLYILFICYKIICQPCYFQSLDWTMYTKCCAVHVVYLLIFNLFAKPSSHCNINLFWGLTISYIPMKSFAKLLFCSIQVHLDIQWLRTVYSLLPSSNLEEFRVFSSHHWLPESCAATYCQTWYFVLDIN